MSRSTLVAVLLSAVLAFDANADDGARIEQLEKETQQLNARVSRLESMLNSSNAQQEIVFSNEGWKEIANWRALSTDMGPADVRKILGEPYQLDGGGVARWYYQNGGRVTFIDGRVSSWQEPRR